MPIYEYECDEHGRMEVWQSIHELPLAVCPLPACGLGIVRLISLPAGYVVEPHGSYRPTPGRDKKGRMNEEKISPREAARDNDRQRAAMLETRKRAIRQGQTIHWR